MGSRFEMETTLLHLDEVGEQAREQRATLAADRLHTLEELRIGEIGELHVWRSTPRIALLLGATRTRDEVVTSVCSCEWMAK